jgi:hypothetical protein
MKTVKWTALLLLCTCALAFLVITACDDDDLGSADTVLAPGGTTLPAGDGGADTGDGGGDTGDGGADHDDEDEDGEGQFAGLCVAGDPCAD